jgi:hypothetical protein
MRVGRRLQLMDISSGARASSGASIPCDGHGVGWAASHFRRYIRAVDSWCGFAETRSRAKGSLTPPDSDDETVLCNPKLHYPFVRFANANAYQ